MKLEHLEFLDILLGSPNWVSVCDIEELHEQIDVNYYTAEDSTHFVNAQSKLFISISSFFKNAMLIDYSSEKHRTLWAGFDLDKQCITLADSAPHDLACEFINLIPQYFQVNYKFGSNVTIQEFKKLHGSKE